MPNGKYGNIDEFKGAVKNVIRHFETACYANLVATSFVVSSINQKNRLETDSVFSLVIVLIVESLKNEVLSKLSLIFDETKGVFSLRKIAKETDSLGKEGKIDNYSPGLKDRINKLIESNEVKILKELRNKHIAHASHEVMFGMKNFEISFTQVKKLITMTHEALNEIATCLEIELFELDENKKFPTEAAEDLRENISCVVEKIIQNAFY